MKTTKHLQILFMVLIVMLALPQYLLSGPTNEERQKIQEMINRGNKRRTDYEMNRLVFVITGMLWNHSQSSEDKAAALQAMAAMDSVEKKLRVVRDSTIDQVDSTFDLGIPPGVDIHYDPNCGADEEGFTSARCYIRICEGSFKDGPDWVASTKLHEYEHQLQKARGTWGIGVPNSGPCTYKYHWNEVEAYNAEICADFGSRTHLSKDQKQEMWNRKMYHIRSAAWYFVTSWSGSRILGTLPDTRVGKAVTIANESDASQYVYGVIENDCGWETYPDGFSFVLDCEQETTFTVEFVVPDTAEIGIGNEVWCHSYAMPYAGEAAKAWGAVNGGASDRAYFSEPDTASDFFFINVTATVDVTSGDNVAGEPGQIAGFDLTVENLGTTTDSFEVYLASVLGWPLTECSWTVTLAPSESVQLSSGVGIPDSLPYTTDLIFCRAASLTSPAQSDSAWLSVMVEGAEAGAESPDPRVFAFLPNAPNPFASGTLLRFSMPVSSPVSLSIYDVRGRLVRQLVDTGSGSLAPGLHTYGWDGRDNEGHEAASGVYFSQLQACKQVATRKMVLLR